MGYLAEYRLRKMWFSDTRISKIERFSNHNRTHKADLVLTYKNAGVGVQVKSLQTNTVRKENGRWIGKFQCDASDSREVRLPNGDKITTTCLVVGEFDLLAVNLFEFNQEWRFAFARNKDLPRTTYSGYTPEQRKYLLSTMMDISWPLEKPFEPEPFRLLDQIAKK